MCRYKMFVIMPAVPAFAGDLKSDDALGTRAIMEFQYNSINRGHGHSIYEEIQNAGFNPLDYIRFYNLRNYDRINASGVMRDAEQRSGVSYEQAREGYDASNEATRGDYEGARGFESDRDYQAYRPPPTAEYGVYEMDGSSSGQGSYHQNQGYGQDSGYGSQHQRYGQNEGDARPQYQERPDESKRDDYNRYQQAASQIGGRQGLGDGRWDSVSEVSDI